VTGSGHPASGMVYKLVAHDDASGAWHSVAKKSANKATVAGRKVAVRSLQNGIAYEETISVAGLPSDGRSLLVPLMTDGEPLAAALGSEGTLAARAHHAAALAELPEQARRLSAGDPAIPTRYVGSTI
jgi:nicotinate phosphoribosyltransferase